MMECLLKAVKDFFSLYAQKGDTFVLGFSGGVDSSALLSLVSDCLVFFDFTVHVAHFDHAWRPESLNEARLLQEQVEALGFSFHGRRSLQQGFLGSNKEDRARQERYEFLEDVYQRVGAKGLLLAHQKEDQAETVLKRIFEGASLFSLGGMAPVSWYRDMRVLRPLLSISKKTLHDWNCAKNIVALDDYTNRDLQFLRPRIREKLFPELERWFGKSVIENLYALGENIFSLKEFMNPRIVKLLESKKEGFLGFMIPLQGLERFEQELVIRACLREKGAVFSREVLDKICLDIFAFSSNKRFDVSKGNLWVDKGALFWFAQLLPEFKGSFSWERGLEVTQEDWVWETRLDVCEDCKKSLLESFLQGEVRCKIPADGVFSLCSYQELKKKDREKVSAFLSENKIPAVIRKIFPFIIKDGELLDLRSSFIISTKEENLSIKLKKT